MARIGVLLLQQQTAAVAYPAKSVLLADLSYDLSKMQKRTNTIKLRPPKYMMILAARNENAMLTLAAAENEEPQRSNKPFHTTT